jgi:hypothetical protein
MNYANTTPLRIGMAGEFLGVRYRIVGRVVMGMEEGGETYTWNEFNMIADDGSCATLVHEVTEHGAEWKIFTLIEPSSPMTAAEAARKRVGDFVDIAGKPMRVTCVDESRVLHIEGEAPEGVEIRDVAHYFNAETASDMVVVSWTGDEVEVYRGVTLPGHAVMNAFGVTSSVGNESHGLRALSGFEGSSGSGFTANGRLVALVFVVLATVAGIWLFTNWRARRPVPMPRLPKAQLAVGQSGDLNARRFEIKGRVEMEIARVGKRELRHEYVLNDSGDEALLSQGWNDDAEQWCLLTPFRPERVLKPAHAATLDLGESFEFDGSTVRVTTLFLSRIKSTEGMTPFESGSALYGLLAKAGNEAYALRWTETNIAFYRVTPQTGKTVTAAFK